MDDPTVRETRDVAAALGTDLEHGLGSPEAARRLARDGPNALRSPPRKPAWRRFLAQFQDPLVYLLLAAIVVSLGAWVHEGLDGWPVDAIVIAAIVILNAVLGHVQGAKAQQAVAALARMSAPTAAVVRDGRVQRVPSASLVVGDLLVLAEGDAVAADARLVRAAALRVQQGSLTGESEAALKDAGVLSEPAALGDRANMVFNGTSVAQGTGRAVVVATGMDTEVGGIAGMLAATGEEVTPLGKEVAHLGRMLGIGVLVIATVVVATILLVSRADSTAEVVAILLLGVALAVAAVPEGLPAILSVVLALGVQRMASRNAIIKDLSSVETLGSTSVICTDKTGT
ncbi:MAG: ATPase, type, partial [Ramlibacter sp.]|nr:ATPase, type [Ramlibacter sp.]